MKKRFTGVTEATTIIMLLSIIVTPAHATTQMPNANTSSGATPTSKVSLLWNSTIGSYTSATPAVKNGLIYALTFGTLQCINASTGTQLWTYSGVTPNAFEMLNAFDVENGYVCVAAVNSKQGGIVTCLNAYNGSQLWNYYHGQSFASVIIHEGTVYAAGFNTYTQVGFIYSFELSTGKIIWSFSSSDTRFDWNTLVLTEPNLYAVSTISGNTIFAFNAHTGKELWNHTVPGLFRYYSFSPIVVSGQNVYVTSDFDSNTNSTANNNLQNNSDNVYESGVLALNALNGIKLWDYPINNSVNSPVINNGKIYFASGDGVIRALDASNGGVIWNYTAKSDIGSVLAVNNSLYVGAPMGVYCFNASNGAVIWNFTDPDYTGAAGTLPVYADGVIYFGWNGLLTKFGEHNFYALDAVSGQKLWNYTIGYSVEHAPAVVDNTVYIGPGYGAENFIALNSTIVLPPPSSPTPTSTILSSPSPTPTSSPSPLQTPTSAPTPSIPAFTSPSASPVPSPSIPEFPSWTIVTSCVAIALAALVTILRKRTQRT